MANERWRRVALAVIVAGAIFRIVWGLWIHPPHEYLTSDMRGYVSRAETLAEGREITRLYTFFQPGTQFILAAVFKIFGSERNGLWAASVLWAVLSSLVPLLVWLWLRRAVGTRAAAIATIVVAVSPMFITYGGFFLSEMPSVLFLVLTLFLIERAAAAAGRARLALAAAAGLAGSLAIAIRHQLIVNLAIAGLVVVFVHKRARVAAVALVALVIPLAGLAAFNARATGQFVGLSETGGFNFFLGQCSGHIAVTAKPGEGRLLFGSPAIVQQRRGRDYFFPNHLAYEQAYFVKQGLRCIRENGLGHIAVVARNITDLGMTSVPWPQSDDIGLRRFVLPTNVLFTLLMPVMFAAGLMLAIGVRDRWKRPAAIMLAHLAAMVPFAILFFGDPRYRFPYDVFGIALLAIIADRVLADRAGRAGERAEA